MTPTWIVSAGSVLTERQFEVLSFINQFREREHSVPTMAEISKHFGWASANAAQCHVDALLRSGVIRRREGPRAARGYIVNFEWL